MLTRSEMALAHRPVTSAALPSNPAQQQSMSPAPARPPSAPGLVARHPSGAADRRQFSTLLSCVGGVGGRDALLERLLDREALTALLASTPAAYNKDLQEDKEPLFDAVQTAHDSVRIANGVLVTLEPNAAAMRKALGDAAARASKFAARCGELFGGA